MQYNTRNKHPKIMKIFILIVFLHGYPTVPWLSHNFLIWLSIAKGFVKTHCNSFLADNFLAENISF